MPFSRHASRKKSGGTKIGTEKIYLKMQDNRELIVRNVVRPADASELRELIRRHVVPVDCSQFAEAVAAAAHESFGHNVYTRDATVHESFGYHVYTRDGSNRVERRPRRRVVIPTASEASEVKVNILRMELQRELKKERKRQTQHTKSTPRFTSPVHPRPASASSRPARPPAP